MISSWYYRLLWRMFGSMRTLKGRHVAGLLYVRELDPRYLQPDDWKRITGQAYR